MTLWHKEARDSEALRRNRNAQIMAEKFRNNQQSQWNLTIQGDTLWQNTLKNFNVDKATANKFLNDLVVAYSHSERYYHNLTHIHHVLNTIDTLQDYTQDLSSVKLAGWLHDIVYDPKSSNNEENSAEYAGNLLRKLMISDNIITTVQELILTTKNHQANDENSQVLLDADLAILALNPVIYQEYSQAIRKEYSWVSEAEYIQGRIKVLKSFCQRERIYYTPLMLEIGEKSARYNLQQEIEFLENMITY